MIDKNVESVRKKLLDRSEVGIKKYGCTTDNPGLSRKQALIHAQEEAMDLAIYLEQLIQLEEWNKGLSVLYIYTQQIRCTDLS